MKTRDSQSSDVIIIGGGATGANMREIKQFMFLLWLNGKKRTSEG